MSPRSRHLQPPAGSWKELQRRLARRSAYVSAHHPDAPQLIATAEDVSQADWDQDVETWPAVVRDAAKLPHRHYEDVGFRGTGIVPNCIIDILPLAEQLDTQPNTARDARLKLDPISGTPVIVPPLASTPDGGPVVSSTTTGRRNRRTPSLLLGLKTPPYARRHDQMDYSNELGHTVQSALGGPGGDQSFGGFGVASNMSLTSPASPAATLPGLATAPASSPFAGGSTLPSSVPGGGNLHRLSANSLNGTQTVGNGTGSLQQLLGVTAGSMGGAGASSLGLAGLPGGLEAAAAAAASWSSSLWASHRSSITTLPQSPLSQTLWGRPQRTGPEDEKPKHWETDEPVAEQVLEKLEYLQTCRQLIGETRYRSERQRLELQACIKDGSKFCYSGREGKTLASPLSTARLEEIGGKPKGFLDAGTRARIDMEEQRRKRSRKPTGNTSFSGASSSEDDSSACSSPRFSMNRSTMSNSGPRSGPGRRTSLLEGVSTSEDAAAGIAAATKIWRSGGGFDTNESSSLLLDSSTFSNDEFAAKVAALVDYELKCESGKVMMPGLAALAFLATSADETTSTPLPLYLDSWALGDEPFIAFARSPLGPVLKRIQHVGLRGNRLTHVGLEELTKCLGKIHSLDLSENSFDRRGAEIVIDFLKQGAPLLLELDLSHNKLDDASTAEICRSVDSSCRSLQKLCLRDVHLGLGVQTGAALCELLCGSRYLTSLDVSYNSIQGQGACSLLEGICIAASSSGELRHVDLGWNSLGLGSLSHKVVDLLASVFTASDGLLHFDISYNALSAQDCQILAEALASNRTLWGLHIEGNAAVLDFDGFIHPLADVDPPPQPAEEKQAAKSKKKAGKGKRGQKDEQGTNGSRAIEVARLDQVRTRLELNEIVEEKRGSVSAREIAERPYSMLHVKDAKAYMEQLAISRRRLGRALSPKSVEVRLQNLQVRSHLKNKGLIDILDAGAKHMNAKLAGPTGEPAPHLLPSRNRGKWPAAADKDLMKQGFRETTACWLCGGWVEMRLILTPGVSFGSDVTLKHGEVFAFTSLDNFARPTELHYKDHVWKGSRWMPPAETTFFVIFMASGKLFVAQDMPVRPLAHPLRIPIRTDLSEYALWRSREAKKAAALAAAAAAARAGQEGGEEDEQGEASTAALVESAVPDVGEEDIEEAEAQQINVLSPMDVASQRLNLQEDFHLGAAGHRSSASSVASFQANCRETLTGRTRQAKKSWAARGSGSMSFNGPARPDLPEEFSNAWAKPRAPLPAGYRGLEHLPPALKESLPIPPNFGSYVVPKPKPSGSPSAAAAAAGTKETQPAPLASPAAPASSASNLSPPSAPDGNGGAAARGGLRP